MKVSKSIYPEADHTKLSIYPGASKINILSAGIYFVTTLNLATNKFKAVNIAPFGPNYSPINY